MRLKMNEITLLLWLKEKNERMVPKPGPDLQGHTFYLKNLS